MHGFCKRIDEISTHNRLICSKPESHPVMHDTSDNSFTIQRFLSVFRRKMKGYTAEVANFAKIHQKIM